MNKKFLGLLTRCKDEFFIKEFCDYYLLQGVDIIYIIDDDSNDKSIYNNISNDKIKIIYEKNIIDRKIANQIYKKIKNEFIWMIYVDVDEFITTKKNINNLIKDELETTFKDYDCIKIPWVMMASNGIEKNPDSILKNNIYRWNHDLKHPNKIYKFRCRFWNIETKCIFKTEKFNNITDHYPYQFTSKNISIIESINLKKQKISSYYNKLREKDIKNGYLLCYHYRIISIENSKNKLKNNIWYNKYLIDDLIKSDHSEVKDDTLKKKYI